MAQVGIREYDAKRWFYEYFETHDRKKMPFSGGKMVLVKPDNSLDSLAKKNSWLKKERLVIKPDQLFGKRGKHNLVEFGDFAAVQAFLKKHRDKKVKIGSTNGKLSHFLIESFLVHKEEFYLAITTERDGDRIYFSSHGGIEIEENWNKVKSSFVPVLAEIDKEKVMRDFDLKPNARINHILGEFIVSMHHFFMMYGLSYLEFNPFTFDRNLTPVPLDMVVKVDSTEAIECAERWGNIEFPAPFGREVSKEEAYIHGLDERSGASLKLTVLNPEGRVWTMVAGGGASVIYADTICDLGFQKELANYGEYSGNPSKEETYLYAKTVLDLMTQKKHSRGKFLIIGGGIANFTDVAKTFEGIIKALQECHKKLKDHKVKVFVRRGGPNSEAGLKMMHDFGKEYGVTVEIHGPEMHMTRVVKLALTKGTTYAA